MKRLLKITLVLFSIVLSTNAQEKKQEFEDFKVSFQSFVLKKMKKHDVAGASVTILMDNKVIVNDGYGFIDLKEKVASDSNTVYPIGSVSKIVTSTAVLKLYSDGIIDIDKPYIEYVPDFKMKKHFSGPIDFTVRHLLSHYAGLPRLRVKGFLKKQYRPLDNLMQDSRDEYLIAPAGKVYQYSDWGVDLLALLVQRVTKMPYEEFVTKNIFKPLGMEHSGFEPISNLGYMYGKETRTYEYSYSGSDGVYSTPSDLSKLTQVYFFEENSFLKPNIVKQALTHQFVDAPLAYDNQIGLMWEIRPLRGFRRVKKAGVHEPFYTYIFFVPEYGVSAIICSNSNASSKLHWDVWSKTFDFASKKFNLKGGQSPIKKKRSSGKTILTDFMMKELQGTYSTNIGILNLQPNGTKFDVTLSQDNRKGIATVLEEQTLKVAVKKMGLKIPVMDIHWDKIGHEYVLSEQYKSGNRMVMGSKIKNEKIPDTWRQALGSYKVTNYSEHEYKTLDRVQLLINEFNVLEVRVNASYPNEMEFRLGLSPISDTAAIIPGYNFEFFGGETIELIKKGNDYSLKFSGYELQKLKD